ncbi:10491_t:CDS:2, partial [Dentiscutata heterogama]
VSISKDEDCENEDCNSCILKIEFRENQNKKALKGCILCDDEIAELLENKFAKKGVNNSRGRGRGGYRRGKRGLSRGRSRGRRKHLKSQ